jgi:hypothetical protein
MPYNTSKISTTTSMARPEKSSTQKLFERNLLIVCINTEAPKFWDIEALLDSLAVRRPLESFVNPRASLHSSNALRLPTNISLELTKNLQRFVIPDADSLESYDFMLTRFARNGTSLNSFPTASLHKGANLALGGSHGCSTRDGAL